MEGPEPTVTEIEYLKYEDLREDLGSPEECLITVFERLENKNWVVVCGALTDVRKLAKFHPERITEDQLTTIVALSLKAINNPRSALCKTAIMTVSDLFKSHPNAMLAQLDKILLPLLLKAFQDKKFVCEESERALSSMAFSLEPRETLNQLHAFTAHKNPRVRAKAATAYFLTASRMDSKEIESYGFPRLMKVAASQINDQFPEARDSGRKLLLHLKTSFSKLNDEKETVNPNTNEGGLDSPENKNENVSQSHPDEKKSTPWEEFCKSILSNSELLPVLKLSA